MSNHSPKVLLALLLCGVAPAAVPARADSVTTVFNGQKIEGDSFPGEAVRITLPMAQGTIGKLRLKFTGSSRPVSITSQDTQVVDPDGIALVPTEDPDGDLVFGPQIPGKGSVKLKLNRLVAKKTGDYVLTLRTNAKDRLRAKGKWKILKRKKIAFEGDENSGDFVHHLQQNGEIRIQVKTGDGAAPRIESFEVPDGTRFTPKHTYFNKKGAKTIWLRALSTGRHAFRIGYQQDGTAGSFTGKVKFKTKRSAFGSVLKRANPPGVALSTLPSDRNLAVAFGDSGVGLAVPLGGLITVTTVKGGRLLALRVTDQLQTILTESVPIEIATAADFSGPGEVIGGHRLTFTDGHHFAAFSSQTGKAAGLVKFTRTLAPTARTEFVNNSTTSTEDLFFGINRLGSGLFLGLVRSQRGHTVHTLDLELNATGSKTIGTGAWVHDRGAVAQWNPTADRYELWAPDFLTPGVASDLNRQLYSEVWDPTLDTSRPVADPAEQETMSTALSVDVQSGVSIVHYVVVRQPSVGTGEIHRRMYESDGTEVPGSHEVLRDAAGTPRIGLNRPTSLVFGDYLYLGYDTLTGPFVERIPLLR